MCLRHLHLQLERVSWCLRLFVSTILRKRNKTDYFCQRLMTTHTEKIRHFGKKITQTFLNVCHKFAWKLVITERALLNMYMYEREWVFMATYLSALYMYDKWYISHVMSTCKIIMSTCLNQVTCQHNCVACWHK